MPHRIALLIRREDFYATGHPTASDVLLIVEVGESSAELDWRVKIPLYARSGISEVWLFDLGQQTLTTYGDPLGDGYRTIRVLRQGARVTLSARTEVVLEVEALLA